MNAKILVIGAGIAQADAIVRAREMGYYVFASDGDAHAPGLRIANEGRVIDVKDVDAHLEWARKEKIDGVISYAADVCLPTVLAVREDLGLPGLGRFPMEVSLDKSRQRDIFKEAGLSQPQFALAGNDEELKKAVEITGLPVVVKPVDNSGSIGVSIVRTAGMLKDAFMRAKAGSKKGKVILEQFMEGLELTVEGFSINGVHHILAISDKFKPEWAECAAMQLAYPAQISSEAELQVVELMKHAYDAAKVDNTPTHSEVILTESGPKIVEMGCRGGGFYVFTKVVQAVSGYDIVANWTRLCTGGPIENVRAARAGVVLRFMISNVSGELIRIKGIEDAQAIEGVEVGMFYSPGDIIPKFHDDGSRAGWMIVRGKDRNDALHRADMVSSMIFFETRETHD
jgi:biotin carboxylase